MICFVKSLETAAETQNKAGPCSTKDQRPGYCPLQALRQGVESFSERIIYKLREGSKYQWTHIEHELYTLLICNMSISSYLISSPRGSECHKT